MSCTIKSQGLGIIGGNILYSREKWCLINNFATMRWVSTQNNHCKRCCLCSWDWEAAFSWLNFKIYGVFISDECRFPRVTQSSERVGWERERVLWHYEYSQEYFVHFPHANAAAQSHSLLSLIVHRFETQKIKMSPSTKKNVWSVTQIISFFVEGKRGRRFLVSMWKKYCDGGRLLMPLESIKTFSLNNDLNNLFWSVGTYFFAGSDRSYLQKAP